MFVMYINFASSLLSVVSIKYNCMAVRVYFDFVVLPQVQIPAYDMT